MVLHIPQTIGGKVESAKLIRLEINMQTPQTSSPVVGPIQDCILASYLASFPDIFMTESQFRRYIGQSIYISVEKIGKTMPFMISKTNLNSNEFTAWRRGSQLLSQVFPEGFHYTKNPSYFHRYPEIQTKTFDSKKDFETHIFNYFNEEKPEVVILNSEIHQGRITKSQIGTSNSGILHQMIQEYGNQITLRYMSDLQRVMKAWFADYGFSVGPSDCVLPNEKDVVFMIEAGLESIRSNPLLKVNALRKKIIEDEDEDEVLSEGDEEINLDEDVEEVLATNKLIKPKKNVGLEISETIKVNQLEDISHVITKKYEKNASLFNREQERLILRKQEQILLKILHKYTNFIGNQAMKQLKYWNRFSQMSDSGAKGNEFNIRQIVAMIGQTELFEGRPKLKNGRATAHFARPGMEITADWMKWVLNDSLLEQGFIKGCFGRQGLNPIEFLNHQKASRQGISSSVLLTGETGYAHRKLIQGTTNLIVKQDLSVRDQAGNLLQIIYGQDGFDATFLNPIPFPFIAMDNNKLSDYYSAIPYLITVLWPLELQMENQNRCQSTSELGSMLLKEGLKLKIYRDIVRSHIMHYRQSQLNIMVSVPADIKLIIQSAVTRQNKRSLGKFVGPSMLLRLLYSFVERLYSYYPGFYNRLWCFEALIFSELCVKNILINYRLDYESFEYVLSEIEARFSKCIIDPELAVGMLASQSAGELYTQGALDQHRHAGSNDIEEGGGINVFKELISLTNDPKNPSMVVYPVSLELLNQLFDPFYIEKCIFRGAVQESEKKKKLAQFTSNKLLYQSFSDILVDAPKLIMEKDLNQTSVLEDQKWYNTFMCLLNPQETQNLCGRSKVVIRFILDASKCSELNMGPYDVVQKIKKCMKELSPIESNLWNDHDMIAIVSPNLHYVISKDKSLDYWVIRLYVSKFSSVYLHEEEKKNLCFNEQENEIKIIQTIAHAIYTKTHVHGINGITSAVVKEENLKTLDMKTGGIVDSKDYVIYTRGSNLQETLGLPFVDDSKTHSTHILDTNTIFGIESAANALFLALQKSLRAHGSNISERHLEQIVKTITHRGELMRLNRYGINKQVDVGVLQKASFEQPMEVLADACSTGHLEILGLGITENCMLGKEVPVGTGAQNIELQKVTNIPLDVMESHANFIRLQTIPVCNQLDKRVMLKNSGEEKNYHNDQFNSNDKQFLHHVEYTMHQQNSDLIRWSTLNSQKDLVSSSQEVYSESFIVNDEDKKNHDEPQDENVSLFWNQMEEKRRNHQEWIKKRVAAHKCLNDHTELLKGNIKKRKKNKVSEEKEEKKEEEIYETKNWDFSFKEENYSSSLNWSEYLKEKLGKYSHVF